MRGGGGGGGGEGRVDMLGVHRHDVAVCVGRA